MIKKPIVFSLIREQSMFMTAIMSLLSFLSVLALGISLSIGTGVMRWNNQWELFATIQVTDTKKVDNVKKIIANNSEKIESAKQISTDEMQELMAPWVSDNGAIKNYLPQMWEIQFKTESDLNSFGKLVAKDARFLTHASALSASTSAGWQMIIMSVFILILMLGAIGICISYIAQNTALLHKRELEILNQVGASDNFITRQMQIIVAKICTTATTIGFIAAVPVLLIINSIAHGARVGLMATMGISNVGWAALILLPIVIVIFAISITRKTTIRILKNS